MTCAWDWSGVRRCGAGLANVGTRCGGATIGDDAVSDGMMCVWDRSGVRWCGTRPAVTGMKCGGSNLGVDARVCFVAAWRKRAEGMPCTGARLTLGDGARGAGETSGTAQGDRGTAVESEIVASCRMVCS